MSNWLINQCSIISFEIEIFPVRNSTEQALHQFYSFKNHLKSIQIDNLQSNQDYQLQIKVNSQAGEIIKIVSFRTTNDQNLTKSRSPNYYIIIIIIAASCLLALISSIIVFISIKFCRLHWKNAGKYPEVGFFPRKISNQLFRYISWSNTKTKTSHLLIISSSSLSRKMVNK